MEKGDETGKFWQWQQLHHWYETSTNNYCVYAKTHWFNEFSPYTNLKLIFNYRIDQFGNKATLPYIFCLLICQNINSSWFYFLLVTSVLQTPDSAPDIADKYSFLSLWDESYYRNSKAPTSLITSRSSPSAVENFRDCLLQILRPCNLLILNNIYIWPGAISDKPVITQIYCTVNW